MQYWRQWQSLLACLLLHHARYCQKAGSSGMDRWNQAEIYKQPTNQQVWSNEKCAVNWMKFNLATIQQQDNIIYK
jgi:hypothetical protein